MGVKGLWELLSPVGRRINIETLEGKILAIDASIWITQFIKAMRDEEGKVMKNAHLIGTLRRILKLLHHRIKTVFVFDGSTPTLKIQTVRARRLLREKQEINLKKSAEKLLLAKIKRHLLEKASNSKNEPSRIAPEFHPLHNEGETSQSTEFGKTMRVVDDMNEEVRNNIKNKNIGDDEDEDEGEAEGEKEEVKEEAEDVSDGGWEEGYSHLHDKELSTDNRRNTNRRNQVVRNSDDEDDEESWIIPENTDEIDSGTLASLPPTIRKHVIEEARKKESRRNRSHYLPVAEDPLLYSKTQLANFLRTSKFNQVVIKTQEESDRMEREKFGSGHIISSDGNRRYILRKGDEKEAEDDMSWLNDDDDDDDNEGLKDSENDDEVDHNHEEKHSTTITTNKLSQDEGNDSTHTRKRRRVVNDESDSDGEINDDHLEGGFIRPSDSFHEQSHSEGGFFRELSKEESGFVRENQEVLPTSSQDQWICLKCTLFNEIFDTTCAMCGTSRTASSSSSSSSSIHSTIQPNSQAINTSPDQVSLELKSESESKSVKIFEVTTPKKLNPEPIQEIPPPPPPEDSSSDEWEDNEYEETVNVSQSIDTPVVISTQTASATTTPTTPSATTLPSLKEDIISRAVSSASSMGDWAGRAVRRALQGSSLAPTPSSSSTTQNEKETSPNHKDIELILPLTQSQNRMIEEIDFMRESSTHVDNDRGNGFEVDELEFQRRALRDADVLNDTMVNDIKALLDAFDIPYISAPYEAEAQCAFLEMAGLVDGVVTEDSDIFLFGGKCVYKNIFEDKKYVEAYLAEDIRKDLGIDRGNLIALAYLLGSDYTDGVKGVGIVNAMEILEVFGSKVPVEEQVEPESGPEQENEQKQEQEQEEEQQIGSSVNRNNSLPQGGFFSNNNFNPQNENNLNTRKKPAEMEEEGQDHLKNSIQQLKDFKEWLLTPYDFSSLKIFQKKTKNKGKNKKQHEDEHDDEENFNDPSPPTQQQQQQQQDSRPDVLHNHKLEEFSRKHVGMRKKWTVRESFPDHKIAEAYYSPQVNKLTEKFQFETPKLFKIKKYVSQVLAWTEEEIANKITPVIQRYIEERGVPTQSRIDSYFYTYHDDKRFASIQSERLKKAVSRVRKRQHK